MAQIQVISPEGELGRVDDTDLQKAVTEEGYKLATQADIAEHAKQLQYGEGLENVTKAGLAGAARSASFGASDYLLPKLPGGPTQEALSERQKRNPISSGLGEAAGIVGSLALAPGGGIPGLVGKLGQGASELAAGKTASSVLGKVASHALGSAVEGAFYGAGHVVSESALGAPGLTAQKALSQIRISSLLAGGLGAALKVGEAVAPKIADAVSSASGKAFDKASSFVSGLPEAEIAALRANRTSEAAGSLGDVIGGLKDTSHGADSLLGLGSLGMAAHAIGVPGKVVTGGLAAYSALKNPELTMSRLAKLEGVIQKATQNITSATDSIFNSSRDVIAPMVASAVAKASQGSNPKEVDASYDKAVNTIQKALSHPENFMEVMNHATEDLYPHAPNVTAQIQTTIASGLQFLQTKIPQPAVQMPLSPKFQPSQASMAQFLHYNEIVNNPLHALTEMRTGTLTKDTIEALEMVHPKLYADMKQSVLSKLMSVKGKEQQIPYQTRAMVSQFLKQPLDESFMPSSIMATQGIFMGPQKSNQGMGLGNTKSGGHGLSGLSKLNVASRATLGTQKVNLGQKL